MKSHINKQHVHDAWSHANLLACSLKIADNDNKNSETRNWSLREARKVFALLSQSMAALSVSETVNDGSKAAHGDSQ